MSTVATLAEVSQQIIREENDIRCRCGVTITLQESHCSDCQRQAADVRAWSELEDGRNL
jgi:hypothetical protein